MTNRIPEMTERSFHLTCKIDVRKLTFEDYQSSGKFQNENYFVFLFPVEGDERTRFLGVWMPDMNNQHFEVVIDLGSPINLPARAAVFKSRTEPSYIDKPHLQLMSYGIIQDIIEHREMWGREINVTVLPESEEAEADYTLQGELPFNKKQYKELPTREEAIEDIRHMS